MIHLHRMKTNLEGLNAAQGPSVSGSDRVWSPKGHRDLLQLMKMFNILMGPVLPQVCTAT